MNDYQEICNAVKSIVCRENVDYDYYQGNEKCFSFSSHSDLFKIGSKLFSSGFILERPAQLARRLNVTRAAINNRLRRDHTLVSLQVEGDREVYIVSKVEG
jgi:hypothetical protein